jgi:hypothetical protein
VATGASTGCRALYKRATGVALTKEGLSMADMEYVDSVSVEQIGYDADQSEVHVVFRKGGSHYICSDVLPNIFEDFRNAPSKGRFVPEVLKGHGYPYRKA